MEGEWTAVDEQGSGSSDENKIDSDDDGAHTVNIGAESDDENESKFSNRAVNRKLENISQVQVRFPHARARGGARGGAGRYGEWVWWERDSEWWRVEVAGRFGMRQQLKVLRRPLVHKPSYTH